MNTFKQVLEYLASDTLFTFYALNLRTPFFSAFFTLSSFLLATTTFVVTNMKRDVYDSSAYRRMMDEMRQIQPSLSYYGGLLRLSNLLIATVCISFCTASLQLTLGLHAANWSALVCIGSAFLTLALVGFVLYVVHSNIVLWISQVESEARNVK